MTSNLRPGIWLIFTLSISLLSSSPLLRAQEQLSTGRGRDLLLGGLFSKSEALVISIEFDVRQLQRERKLEEYQPARLYLEGDSLSGGRPVRIRPRGTTRRQYCGIPPIWINFRDSGLETEGLAGVRKIKLVADCRTSKTFSNYVLREYLVYRMYELLTPYSFRTRLVRVKYVDSEGKTRDRESWGFLIEPLELMTRRLGARHFEDDMLSMARVQPRAMDRLAMFHFMVGNTDFSITGRHNTRIIQTEQPGSLGLVPVPYDFDFTGIVNAVYAQPREGLGLSTVKDRYYDGPCRTESRHSEVLEEFRELEDAWMELITGFEYLEEQDRQRLAAYLGSFFSELDRQNFIERRILSSCRE